MDSGRQSAAQTQLASPVTRVLGPRPVIITGAALAVLAVVAVLAQLVLSSQHASRNAAQERFVSGAAVRGQLTASLLATTSSSLRAAAVKLPPTRKALNQLAASSHLGYAAILSSDGSVVASSSGATPAVLRHLAARPAYVRQALSGRTWISDVQPAAASGAPTLGWALPFPSAAGRRVLVEGLPTAALSPFLTSFLDQGSSGRAVYVVDSKRHLIASSKSAGLAKGAGLPASLAGASDISSRTIGGSYVAAAGIGGSGWRLVLTQSTAALYPGITGSRSWLLWAIVALVAIVGFASLIPLRRSQMRAAQLAAAHAEVSALNASLEAKVADRTELAERRAHALSRSNAELEQFASVAAHDLQEPLRKIRMYCERLQRRGDELPDDMRDDVTRMEGAAGRMQNLISDLLDLARVNSRGRELVAIDLGEVAREVKVDLEARIDEVGATVVIDDLPSVLGDGVQLRQVIQNLLSNALKFHREGVPLHVRLRTETTRGGRCVIAVEDNGIGFDEKYAERIFGTFQRLHGRAQYEGTGIGLSIARKIAWRHDGDITATASEGEGATFRLTLPLAPAQLVAAPVAGSDPVTQPQSERNAA
jgi:signal transduction histidine kinase